MNDEKIEKGNNPYDTDESPVEEQKVVNPLEEAEMKAEEFRDKYLRVVAEMENLRRRTDREIQDIQSYSNAAFARDMLSVSDNLSRALESSPKDKDKIANSGLKSLIDGIEMTKREMMSTLEKYGIKKIEAEGNKFNPNYHQAMFEEQNETIPANTVIKVVQDGYLIGERILRPSLVGISKGNPYNPQKQDDPKECSNSIDDEDTSSTTTKE
ncbi:nucleotide exchange factor GrpE [Candidatus Liberibacter americanus]|uniref:Protein GrpE n=1 Tax=Candidatus Liberibacter americanus str. Sao Paulo TaxID=1261131 RepID=U6B791_9HYPH|nr:nucleotide exchange factor GrpE [Candidatus Liberibacter americanus]AHA27622.1 Molecular chaperone GrpE [Candidatus Liberibacter americanus str. Sao Paulo]EMS36331.1 heat shock protein [Candidatus Liberibacter americanus PW_SP]